MDNDTYITDTVQEHDDTQNYRNVRSVKDMIIETEYQLSKFIDHINKLWDEVMLPYLNDVGNKVILTKLDIHDRVKFTDFMIDNNPVHQYLMETLKYLKTQI